MTWEIARYHGVLYYCQEANVVHCCLQVCREETVYGDGEEAEEATSAAATTPKTPTPRNPDAPTPKRPRQGGVSAAVTPATAMSTAGTRRSTADYTCYSLHLSKSGETAGGLQETALDPVKHSVEDPWPSAD